MIVSPLRQALCSDRSRVTNDPDPERWLAADVLPFGMAVHEFHFFVDWRHDPPVVGDRFLLTRLVDFDEGENPPSISNRDVLKAFGDAGLLIEFKTLERVGAEYGKNVVSVLLPECETSKLDDATPFWIVSGGGDREPAMTRSTVARLKNAIRKHSGGPVHIGKKGLIYSTSAIECLPSLTDAGYPGDADAVVVDGDGHVRYVIEFKKHTLATPLGEHLAGRYYPAPDGRKFRRLHALALSFEGVERGAVPLVIFCYSTKRPPIRLQLVGALDGQRMDIDRDSWDFGIEGMSDREVADRVLAWLGVRE